MAKGPADKPIHPKKLPRPSRTEDNSLIADKLRVYYDSIIEEGTPAHLLDLLERLHDAETKPKK